VRVSSVTLGVLALAGCDVTIGAGDEGRTVTTPAKTVTEEEVVREGAEEQPPPEPTGPSGALGTDSVGPVTVGMPSEEVEALFGQPDRKETVNFGQGAPPQIDWIWTFDDGEFRLQFETDDGTITGYVSETSELATVSGVSVGDSFGPIRDRYGDQLERPVIAGESSWLLSDNEPGTYPALTFELDGDTVTSIKGGEPQAAGE
jgi:hypothetical protein